MAARTYDQILAALDPGYAGSRKLLQDSQAAIPGEVDAGIAQTDAKLKVANTGILDAARRRGLGFSGIPVGEQAQYAATEYAPAIARMRSEGANRAMSLQEALLGYDREQRSQAQSIYDAELARDFQERQFAEQIRQFNEQQAAARAAASGGYGFGGLDVGGGAPGGAGAASKMVPKQGGGFAFTDANGRAISAAAYAAKKGIPFRSLLSTMASQGDRGAKVALGFVGDDFGYDRAKVTDPRLAGIYNSLVWGTGVPQATAYQPKAKPTSKGWSTQSWSR